jgi:hypothetical protein
MKELLKIKYSSQAQLREKQPSDVELLQISERAGVVNFNINVPGSYFSDKNKNYNLVILTDEELKGLGKIVENISEADGQC